MKTSFSSEQEFIKTIAPAAQKACKRYGYLPSVLIAQACLENGYGIPSYWDNQEIKYLLQYNNMVGQKAELLTSSWYDKSVWPGKSFNKNTPEVYSDQQVTIKDNFRIFDNIEQSFCDFILFLLYASNYGYNGKPKYGKEVVNIKDPATLIKEVGSRGYATGPTYPSSVMKIVNKHNLTQYDDLSTVEASNYIPDALRNQYKTTGDNKMNITEKTIYDVTAQNRSQVPASRGNNPIQWIVVHYLGVANADNENLYGGGYGGHYYVSRAGKIYKAADPRTAVVWHCGGNLQGINGHKYFGICTNYNSIGIENGVNYDGKWYFTKETQESLIYLVSKLMDEYNIDINHVIRHYDVTGKICPAPYVNNDNYKTNWTWDQFKLKLMTYRNETPKEEEKISNVKNIIEKATQYMINIANDNNHGYDQIYRWNEKGDFDCSSLVISAWQQAGVPVKTKGATYTGNMYNVFLKCGFVDVTKSVNLNNASGMQRGDVLLNHVYHTAMYIGNNQECQASINEKGRATGGTPGDQTGQEIKIRSYRNYPWNCVLRYTNGQNIVNTNTNKKSVEQIAKEIIANKWGVGQERKNKLTAAGYNYDTIQKKVNEILKKEEEKTNYVESFNKKIAKTYKTTSKLNLRKGPSKDKEVIAIMSKGDKVTCYGYYTKDWYYVQYKNFVGFCDKNWLK